MLNAITFATGMYRYETVATGTYRYETVATGTYRYETVVMYVRNVPPSNQVASC